MDNKQSEELFEIIIKTASVFNQSMSVERARTYVLILNEYKFNDVKNALITCCKEEIFFPLPATIIKKIKPNVDVDGVAHAMLGAIHKAIREFGYSQALAAKEQIGDLAWEAVKNMGGWDIICRIDITSISSNRAQLRQACEHMVKKSHREGFNIKELGFEKRETKQIGEIFGNISNKLLE